jgi:hypothetical protein
VIADNRVIAVEAHFATPAFPRTARDLDVLPGDQTEVDLMRTVENAEPTRVGAIRARCPGRRLRARRRMRVAARIAGDDSRCPGEPVPISW